jgi:arylformamidase
MSPGCRASGTFMHNLRMVSHIGTHAEAPYHVNKGGADVASLPLDRVIGDAVVLDLRGLSPRTEISLAQVRAAAEKVGGVEPGDLVLLQTGWDQYYETPQYSDSPYLASDALQWLIGQGMRMLGIDTGGAEIPGSEQHVNHHAMMDRGIPHIENLRNLGALEKSMVFLMAAPLAVEGLESMPMRVVAMETE